MIVIPILIGVFGLAIGSFLNVVIYRVPAGKSIVSPPSACPHCQHEIKAYDNIPVLSWIVLRGKCRNCNAPISVRYPLVELGTGLVFFLIAFALRSFIFDAITLRGAVGAVIILVAYLYLAAISIALALIDLDKHTLPNVIVLPSYIVAAVLFVAAAIVDADYAALLRAGIAMAALALLYFLIAIIYPGGMGFGDVKLAGVLGLYLGWSGWGPLVVGSFMAFILGGLFGIALIITKRGTRKSGIPFGPWMLIGAWIGIFFGNRISDGYLALVGLRT